MRWIWIISQVLSSFKCFAVRALHGPSLCYQFYVFTYFSTLHSIQFRVHTENGVRNVILALSASFLSFLLNWFWMPNWIIVFTNVMCAFLDTLLHICFTKFMHDAISFNEFLHFKRNQLQPWRSVLFLCFGEAQAKYSPDLVFMALVLHGPRSSSEKQQRCFQGDSQVKVEVSNLEWPLQGQIDACNGSTSLRETSVARTQSLGIFEMWQGKLSYLILLVSKYMTVLRRYVFAWTAMLAILCPTIQ